MEPPYTDPYVRWCGSPQGLPDLSHLEQSDGVPSQAELVQNLEQSQDSNHAHKVKLDLSSSAQEKTKNDDAMGMLADNAVFNGKAKIRPHSAVSDTQAHAQVGSNQANHNLDQAYAQTKSKDMTSALAKPQASAQAKVPVKGTDAPVKAQANAAKGAGLSKETAQSADKKPDQAKTQAKNESPARNEASVKADKNEVPAQTANSTASVKAEIQANAAKSAGLSEENAASTDKGSAQARTQARAESPAQAKTEGLANTESPAKNEALAKAAKLEPHESHEQSETYKPQGMSGQLVQQGQLQGKVEGDEPAVKDDTSDKSEADQSKADQSNSNKAAAKSDQSDAKSETELEAKTKHEHALDAGIEYSQGQRSKDDIGIAHKLHQNAQGQSVEDSESDSMLQDDPLADLKRAAARAKDEKSKRYGTYAQSDSDLRQAAKDTSYGQYSQEPDEQLAALKKAVATEKAHAAAEAQSKQARNPDDPLTALKQALSDPKGVSIESRQAMKAAFDAKREEQRAKDEQSQDDPFVALKHVLSESKENFDKSQNAAEADDPLSSLNQAMSNLGSPLENDESNALNNTLGGANDGAAKINLHTTAAHNLSHTYGAYAKQFKREQQLAQAQQSAPFQPSAQLQQNTQAKHSVQYAKSHAPAYVSGAANAQDKAQAPSQYSAQGQAQPQINATQAMASGMGINNLNSQDAMASELGAAIKDELAKLDDNAYLNGGFGSLHEFPSLEEQAQADTNVSDKEYEATRMQVLTKLMQSGRYEGLTPSFKQEIAAKVMSQAPTQRAMQPASSALASSSALAASSVSAKSAKGQAGAVNRRGNAGTGQAEIAGNYSQKNQPSQHQPRAAQGQAARGGFSVEEMAAAIDENTLKRAAFRAQQERLAQQQSAPAPLPYGDNKHPYAGDDVEGDDEELSFEDLVDQRFRATVDRVRRIYHFPEDVTQGFEQFKNQGNRYKIFHHINANFAKHVNAMKFGGELEQQKASQFIMDKDGSIRRATAADREKERQAQAHALWTAPNIKR